MSVKMSMNSSTNVNTNANENVNRNVAKNASMQYVNIATMDAKRTAKEAKMNHHHLLENLMRFASWVKHMTNSLNMVVRTILTKYQI